ncbi:MAG: iron-containing alcohol dehydrogenase [SAR324 cluster bacterium]|nr:iron-containing alcohol dehydrogenase [SAR324 cluster bacterium]
MTEQGVFTNTEMERVVYGEPCAETLRAEAERLGAERVFLLVSRSLNQNTEVIAGVRDALGGRYAGEYDGMPPHTPRDKAIEAAAAAREVNADLLVTIGGGSVTDAGKMMQLCLRHDITEMDQLDPFRMTVAEDGTRHRPQFEGPQVRQITVPTTLSGGEFNQSAGCTDPRIKVKQPYSHRLMMPRAVVLDPAITVHTPLWLWLSTGVRALDHAVESLCSHEATAHSDASAMHALRLLTQGLPRSAEAPEDLQARLNCQTGVWLSMGHNQTGVPLGASHGIGHVLGGSCGVPHGHTSCVMLPYVLSYNKQVNAGRQALVSEAMGRPGEDAAQVVGDFIAGLGMPRTLREVGVERAQFDLIATNSMHDRCIHTNPRPIKSTGDVMEILEMAG